MVVAGEEFLWAQRGFLPPRSVRGHGGEESHPTVLTPLPVLAARGLVNMRFCVAMLGDDVPSLVAVPPSTSTRIRASATRSRASSVHCEMNLIIWWAESACLRLPQLQQSQIVVR